MKRIMTTTTTTIQVNGTEEFSKDLHESESCAGMNREIQSFIFMPKSHLDNTAGAPIGSDTRQGVDFRFFRSVKLHGYEYAALSVNTLLYRFFFLSLDSNFVLVERDMIFDM